MSRHRGQVRGAAIAETLRCCGLFAGASTFDVHKIATFTVTRNLAKGDYLFHESSPVHGVYIVRRGAIKVHRVNPLGREQVIHIFRPIESLGEESLMSEIGCSADACATEDSQVLLLQKAGFLDMLRRKPELALCLLRSMNHHLHLLIRLLDDLMLKDVKTRFANWLIQHCPDPASHEPIRIRLPSTKRVLAAELGTVSETLSRTVAKFRDLKLLNVEGSCVTLLSPVRLQQFVQSAPGESHPISLP